jgi:hypothetical protein
MGNVKVGAVVTTLMNEVTGRPVDLNIHPWQPQGSAVIRQKTLPMPYSNISETTALATVQDSMQIARPAIQFTYDSSLLGVRSVPLRTELFRTHSRNRSGISTLPPSDSDS